MSESMGIQSNQLRLEPWSPSSISRACSTKPNVSNSFARCVGRRACGVPSAVADMSCATATTTRNGFVQRYVCRDCAVRFDDLSDTILAGHHQPLKVWVLCLYFM